MTCGLLLVAACSREPNPAGGAESEPSVEASEQVAALAALRIEEDALLHGGALGPWSQRSGPDPHAVAKVGSNRYLGLLRGASALVLLDGAAQELHRVEAPAGAIGWAREANTFLVVGERSSEALRVQVDDRRIEITGRLTMHGVVSPRAVAFGEAGVSFIADRHEGVIARVGADGSTRTVAACPGALDVQREGDLLLANCLLSHSVLVIPLDSRGEARSDAQVSIEHDGPIWSMAARPHEGGIELALGGVEDHPLDRSGGGFGYIDSFVFVVRVQRDDEGLSATRSAAINVSEHGVVTPKWMRWQDDGSLLVTAAGSDRIATVMPGEPPTVQVRDSAAGLHMAAGSATHGLAASPLLDRWVVLQRGGWDAVEIDGEDDRTARERVGEALVLTTLLAPHGRSEGKASRFTCETCHFEGTVDGRTHHTGRGDVHATTKTLRGLVGNRPHFSRALDLSTTDMVHNEFRVANHGTDFDPWFSVDPSQERWLALLTDEEQLGPQALRSSMLHFLAAYGPEPNPSVRGRTRFDDLERQGATLFETACERCHGALLRADDPNTRIAPADWEAHIFGGGDLLWGSSPRAMVDIEPLVHPQGPRTPALRRLWTKRPYFTNGSGVDLDAVLDRVRLDETFSHGGVGSRALEPDEHEALAAFLRLL